jgi:hypothetical protein
MSGGQYSHLKSLNMNGPSRVLVQHLGNVAELSSSSQCNVTHMLRSMKCCPFHTHLPPRPHIYHLEHQGGHLYPPSCTIQSSHTRCQDLLPCYDSDYLVILDPSSEHLLIRCCLCSKEHMGLSHIW